jgi:hypothetical protein
MRYRGIRALPGLALARHFLLAALQAQAIMKSRVTTAREETDTTRATVGPNGERGPLSIGGAGGLGRERRVRLAWGLNQPC